MAKVRSPLFGLEAHGSLAVGLTYRRSPTGAVAGLKAAPKQPNSPAQQAQRARYKTELAIWRAPQMLLPEKAAWNLAGKHHFRPLTAFQMFMRDYLGLQSDPATHRLMYAYTVADLGPGSVEFLIRPLPFGPGPYTCIYTRTPPYQPFTVVHNLLQDPFVHFEVHNLTPGPWFFFFTHLSGNQKDGETGLYRYKVP